MAKEIFNIYVAEAGLPGNELVKTINELTTTTVVSEGIIYEDEIEAATIATYLNSLNNGSTYLVVGRPDDRHGH